MCHCATDERNAKLAELPGIGPLTATALAAAVNDGKQFDNGRQMAASLGLTPREHSSGGKQRLMGITKRGDTYLRTLLIHGHAPYCAMPRARPTGSPVGLWPCKQGVGRMSRPWHWPTNSPASPGRCWPAIGYTGRIGRSNRFDPTGKLLSRGAFG